MVGFVDEVLDRWGTEVEEGEMPCKPYMTHMWEALRVFPKPLFVHLFSDTVALMHRLALKAQDFQHHRHKVSRWPCIPVGNMIMGHRLVAQANCFNQ